MLKNRKTLIFVLGLVIAVGGAFALSKTVYVSPTSARATIEEEAGPFQTPFHRLNALARAAKKDNSAASIDKLADAVITDFIPFSLPSDLNDVIRARLVRAELSYRNGGHGISETNIVRVVNDLADRFRTPDYTKTNRAQVRFLRANMIGVIPSLLGQERDSIGKGQKKTRSMNPIMSPAEAVFLTILLLDQKAMNEDFQIEPKEWRDYHNKKATELWRSNHESKGKAPKSSSMGLRLQAPNPKSEEIMRAIQQNSEMNSIELTKLLARSLDTLGIAQ